MRHLLLNSGLTATAFFGRLFFIIGAEGIPFDCFDIWRFMPSPTLNPHKL
jgi:hypothetical protein